MDNFKRFIEITKVDPDKRLVSGYASTEALDSQGEVVEKGAIEKALPSYLGEYDQASGKYRYGNLREMHQLSAVGKTMQAKVDNKGLYIEGKVVDDSAWKKVKEGVYAGFSIGGKIIKQVKNRIQELRLSEISLVDRPANPEAVFAMIKINDGKVTDMQKEDDMETEDEKPKFIEIAISNHILNLAQELRMLLDYFENEGKSTMELEKALTLLKNLAAKILTEDEKKKFETILYGINFEELEKAKLTYQQRKNLPKGEFAYVDSKGGEHLPIQDEAHVKNAIARFGQTQFESPEKKRGAARKIMAAAKRHGIEVADDSAVARAASGKSEVGDLIKYINYNWTPGYFDTLRKVLG